MYFVFPTVASSHFFLLEVKSQNPENKVIETVVKGSSGSLTGSFLRSINYEGYAVFMLHFTF